LFIDSVSNFATLFTFVRITAFSKLTYFFQAPSDSDVGPSHTWLLHEEPPGLDIHSLTQAEFAGPGIAALVVNSLPAVAASDCDCHALAVALQKHL